MTAGSGFRQAELQPDSGRNWTAMRKPDMVPERSLSGRISLGLRAQEQTRLCLLGRWDQQGRNCGWH